MTAAPTEAQTAQPPSDLSSTAAFPRWVLLEPDLKILAEGSSCSTSGDSRTLAAARTSTGHLIQVSLRLAEPPGVSCIFLQIPDGLDAKSSCVDAAHGDSVLMAVCLCGGRRFPEEYTLDHFVYNAGAAAADPPRPPSLSLLQPYFNHPYPTGLLRRGEDDLLLAQLMAVPATPEMPELMRVAELSLLRYGDWISVKSLQIRFRDDSEVCAWEHPSRCWDAVVIPVGDRLLCWVHIELLFVVLCDVFEETPKLQFIWLPRDNILGPPSKRNVCATAGGDALKFINIFPRCCCGEAGATCCKRSHHAYTVHTWTMRLDGGAMEWVMDSVVDATELWALDAYKGLPCLPLDRPVLSLDEPDLICFWSHSHDQEDQPPADGGYWHYTYGSVDLLMVNMRSKTIPVSRHEDVLLLTSGSPIPSKVSYFFNSDRSNGSGGTMTGEGQDIERPPPAIADDDEPSVRASEIFEAFQEIPTFGLDHDEIIKAYSILSHDNCRRFRSFIRLPKNVRKDWLLMEIKARSHRHLVS